MPSTQLNNRRRKFVCVDIRYNVYGNVYRMSIAMSRLPEENLFPATIHRLKLKNDIHLIDFLVTKESFAWFLYIFLDM